MFNTLSIKISRSIATTQILSLSIISIFFYSEYITIISIFLGGLGVSSSTLLFTVIFFSGRNKNQFNFQRIALNFSLAIITKVMFLIIFFVVLIILRDSLDIKFALLGALVSYLAYWICLVFLLLRVDKNDNA